MGALRKAGVWLGLVEDEDEPRYDDQYDDYDDDEEIDSPSPSRSRTYEQVSVRDRDRREPVSRFERERERLGGHNPERSTVRPIGRGSGASGAATYSTRENLALAPSMDARARSIPSERDRDRARYQITTLHPTTYNEARTIGEHFRDGVPVIINLTELDERDAKRLVDFAAGLTFGLRGNMERVTNRVFLLSPANVQVTAEDKARIAEGGYFGNA